MSDVMRAVVGGERRFEHCNMKNVQIIAEQVRLELHAIDECRYCKQL